MIWILTVNLSVTRALGVDVLDVLEDDHYVDLDVVHLHLVVGVGPKIRVADGVLPARAANWRGQSARTAAPCLPRPVPPPLFLPPHLIRIPEHSSCPPPKQKSTRPRPSPWNPAHGPWDNHDDRMS